ncbi:hypothetical protein [Brucella sp. 10RB9213]|uniref:hypothetical protein n=1 Tax=Brucella sp. 10RB9213 TaxID=1844039 RepID=UPI0012AD5417|nr:hypothetical protein [Brucella sp. 10RB9213]MRN66414.1 hypothetical protein [Brucella sp. 10RB9213]
MSDMTYSCHDGMWTRFYPETKAGEDAYRVMSEASSDGVVAFLAPQVPGVLAQLRKVGLVVRKHRKADTPSIEEIFADMEELGL